MSDITNSAINYHIYNSHDGDTLTDQVSRVVMVMLPRALVVSGFSEHGDLLTIRYGEYENSLPAWILDFYEHRFIDEPLLSNPGQVIAGFISSEKYLVVPESVYDEEAALKWIQRLFFVEANEVTTVQKLQEDNARYVFTWPGTMKSLINRYFPNAKTLPLASYQFYKPYKAESAVVCLIISGQAYATLYKNRVLQWHQVFEYETAEDIAYQLKLLCKQQRVDPDSLDLQCSVSYRGLNKVLNELGQYFPNIREADVHAEGASRQWASTISLLQQLYACAL